MKAHSILPFTIVLMLFSAPVVADEPTIVDACQSAVGFTFNRDVTDYQFTNIQSFPELSPPRVSMRPNSDTVFSCRFKQNFAPFEITQYCLEWACYESGEDEFEEIKVLLQRIGY